MSHTAHARESYDPRAWAVEFLLVKLQITRHETQNHIKEQTIYQDTDGQTTIDVKLELPHEEEKRESIRNMSTLLNVFKQNEINDKKDFYNHLLYYRLLPDYYIIYINGEESADNYELVFKDESSKLFARISEQVKNHVLQSVKLYRLSTGRLH